MPDQVVSARKLDAQVGYIRVSMFPGVLGMDVARDMSRAIAELEAISQIAGIGLDTIGAIWMGPHYATARY